MAEEVNLAVDREHWENRLASEERHFVSTILAFFAGSDGLVVENLAQCFCGEIEIPEARCFYGIQMMMYVHCHTPFLSVDRRSPLAPFSP